MLDSQEKDVIEHKSSKEFARLSVSPRRAELFLERLANLDTGNSRRVQALIDTFKDLLPTKTSLVNLRPFFWCKAQPMIQEIWREPDTQIKEWGFMRLAGAYMIEHTKRVGPVGPDGFLLVLLYALKHVRLLRYCANPGCKEPYFVARRVSQIYCSSPCAKPAQKEAKLKWWYDHGAARRKKSSKLRGKHAKAT